MLSYIWESCVVCNIHCLHTRIYQKHLLEGKIEIFFFLDKDLVQENKQSMTAEYKSWLIWIYLEHKFVADVSEVKQLFLMFLKC